MKLIRNTALFIINKWDNESLDVMKPYAQKILYIPQLINNILSQIFYFSIFPIFMYYIYLRDNDYLIQH